MYRDVIFFNDTATTEIYTLSLHDALPIYPCGDLRSGHLRRRPGLRRFVDPWFPGDQRVRHAAAARREQRVRRPVPDRSEEHTSELQSRQYLVCRLLLEKKHLPSPPVSHLL